MRILQQGGNAADAAVAMAAALNVTEPTSTGIGGDVFALFWDAAAKEMKCDALFGVAQNRQTSSSRRWQTWTSACSEQSVPVRKRTSISSAWDQRACRRQRMHPASLLCSEASSVLQSRHWRRHPTAYSVESLLTHGIAVCS